MKQHRDEKPCCARVAGKPGRRKKWGYHQCVGGMACHHDVGPRSQGLQHSRDARGIARRMGRLSVTSKGGEYAAPKNAA